MDPNTATPNTAPISELVLVTEAAMPECSGATTDSGVDVTGDQHDAEADAGDGEDPGECGQADVRPPGWR